MQSQDNKSPASPANSQDYVFKFVIVGDSGVGKSCLMHHFIYNKFKSDTKQTIGVDFSGKVIQVGDQSIKLQIWDTAGQEKFRSVARSYYRGAIGIIIVYDITKVESFQHVSTWLSDAKSYARNECSVCLVGNKSDLAQSRAVATNNSEQFAKDNNLINFECSALTGNNVEEIFTSLTKQVLDKIEKGIIEPNSVVSTYAREMKKTILTYEQKDNERYGCPGYSSC